MDLLLIRSIIVWIVANIPFLRPFAILEGDVAKSASASLIRAQILGVRLREMPRNRSIVFSEIFRIEVTILLVPRDRGQRLVSSDVEHEAHFSSANVKEHAPLSARARVDHGVEVQITEDHENRAADRGCVSRLVLCLHV